MPKDTLVTEEQDLLSALFQETRENLSYFFEQVDLEPIRRLISHLLDSKGTLFLTGVGKSGIIAKKIAMTLASSGTKAIYLSPLDALHGDIGVVSEGDTVLLFSKSGETDELLHLCPALRNKKAVIVAVVSNAISRLVKASDIQVILPVVKELCPFDMVPTTSTLVQLLFGDLLAIALMQAKRFTVDDFAENHPSGRLGKRMTYRVKDLMITGKAVPLAFPDDLLITVLAEISGKKCGCLLVADKDARLLGIFTDGDLRRSLQKYGTILLHKPLKELMTQNPSCIDSKTLAYVALKNMEQDPKRLITHLPVVDDGKLVGLLKMHDIIQAGI